MLMSTMRRAQELADSLNRLAAQTGEDVMDVVARYAADPKTGPLYRVILEGVRQGLPLIDAIDAAASWFDLVQGGVSANRDN